MPRYQNPYYAGPYPTDPTWGMVGSSLSTALFGNPEMAAQAKLNRARVDQAQASAGYDRARTTQTEDVTNARRNWGVNDGLPGTVASIFRGNPDDATADQLNKGAVGQIILDAARGAMAPQEPSGLAGAITRIPGPETTATDDEITVSAPRAVPVPAPPSGPPVSENVMRMLGMLLGQQSDDNTAYTVEQGDAYQGRELDNRYRMNEADNATTRRGQDVSASTTMRGQDISAATSRRGQDITDRRDRGHGSFGKGDPNKPKFVPPTQMDDVDSEILRQMNGGRDEEGNPIQSISDGAMTNVRRKAIEFYQQNGNMAEAVGMSLRYWQNIGRRERTRDANRPPLDSFRN
ncbi:hypothetical protein BSL82_15595 [Tardibacter chloracetimidivorans]|uniref:Uncharacterized protein n=1 Tax=Tardibacter chloracetimidivorans TaxID=1921510 RepID=A0A1L3ZY18_9SPHN|nr:hypothetical protein [Tardibacter chloracetimidivorans]API60528.1 hypothetical protein BSL82_15595 [Tardibacter chloracetimidivorans]